MSASNLFADDPAALFRKAETAVAKALFLAPDHPASQRVLGSILGFTNRVAPGVAKCERALTLDRNLADAHGTIGMLKYFIGRGKETEAHYREALRLSPRDYRVYSWMLYVGVANLWQGADEEAVTWLRRSAEANPNYPLAYLYLAAALAQISELDEARAAAHAGLALHPRFTIGRYRASTHCTHPAFLEGRERTYEGLRIAGVPE
jgi:tetratricopeptide (TPR) repeat protein